MVYKIPYGKKYPSELGSLIRKGLIGIPRQRSRSTDATIGVDITYILKEEGRYRWNIDTLERNLESLLLAVYQDLQRYEKKYPEALFWGTVTYYRGGRKVEAGLHTASLEVFIWGPRYANGQRIEVAQYDLEKHLEAIIELKKKYPKERFEVRRIFVRPHIRLKG